MAGKITIGNVCFVFDKDRKTVLLLKRNKEPMQGMYTGVGGKTEFFEDINASCVREVKEETGLCVREVKLRGVLLSKGQSRTIFRERSNEFRVLFNGK